MMRHNSRHDSAGNGSDRNRLDELLATRATERLADRQLREIEELLGQHGDDAVPDFDKTAALINLASLDAADIEPMPAHLRQRVEADAYRWAHESGHLTPSASPTTITTSTSPARWRLSTRFAWLATAACLALAIFAWLPSGDAHLEAVRLYEELRTSDSAVRVEMSHFDRPDISGDVLWDEGSRQGVVRLRGLDVNDPGDTRYQIWVVGGSAGSTASMSDPHRMAFDGGVFDVTRTSCDTFITIRPPARQQSPTEFVIAITPPGGGSHLDDGGGEAILRATLPDER